MGKKRRPAAVPHARKTVDGGLNITMADVSSNRALAEAEVTAAAAQTMGVITRRQSRRMADGSGNPGLVRLNEGGLHLSGQTTDNTIIDSSTGQILTEADVAERQAEVLGAITRLQSRRLAEQAEQRRAMEGDSNRLVSTTTVPTTTKAVCFNEIGLHTTGQLTERERAGQQNSTGDGVKRGGHNKPPHKSTAGSVHSSEDDQHAMGQPTKHDCAHQQIVTGESGTFVIDKSGPSAHKPVQNNTGDGVKRGGHINLAPNPTAKLVRASGDDRHATGQPTKRDYDFQQNSTGDGAKTIVDTLGQNVNKTVQASTGDGGRTVTYKMAPQDDRVWVIRGRPCRPVQMYGPNGKFTAWVDEDDMQRTATVKRPESENTLQLEQTARTVSTGDQGQRQQPDDGSGNESETNKHLDHNQPTQPYVMKLNAENIAKAVKMSRAHGNGRDKGHMQATQPYRQSPDYNRKTAPRAGLGTRKRPSTRGSTVIDQLHSDSDGTISQDKSEPGGKVLSAVERQNLDPGEDVQQPDQTPVTEILQEWPLGHGNSGAHKQSNASSGTVIGKTHTDSSSTVLQGKTKHNGKGLLTVEQHNLDPGENAGQTTQKSLDKRGQERPLEHDITGNDHDWGNTHSTQENVNTRGTVIGQTQQTLQGHSKPGQQGLVVVEQNNLDPGDATTRAEQHRNVKSAPDIGHAMVAHNLHFDDISSIRCHNSSNYDQHLPETEIDSDYRDDPPGTEPPASVDNQSIHNDREHAHVDQSLQPENVPAEKQNTVHRQKGNHQVVIRYPDWQSPKSTSSRRLSSNKLGNKKIRGMTDGTRPDPVNLNEQLFETSASSHGSEPIKYPRPPSIEPFSVWIDEEHRAEENEQTSNLQRLNLKEHNEHAEHMFVTPELENAMDPMSDTQDMEECETSFQMLADLSATDTVLPEDCQAEVEFVFSAKELDKYNKVQHEAGKVRAVKVQSELHKQPGDESQVKWPEGPYYVQKATSMQKYTVHGVIPEDIAGVALKTRNMKKDMMLCVTDDISIRAFIRATLGDVIKIEQTSWKLADERARTMTKDTDKDTARKRVWIGPPTQRHKSDRTPYFVYATLTEWNRLQSTETWYLGPADRELIQMAEREQPASVETLRDLELRESQMAELKAKAKRTPKSNKSRSALPGKPFKEVRKKRDDMDSDDGDGNGPQQARQSNQPKRIKMQTDRRQTSNVAVQTIDMGKVQERISEEKTPELTTLVRKWDKKELMAQACRKLADISGQLTDDMAILCTLVKPVEAESVRNGTLEEIQQWPEDSKKVGKIKRRWRELLGLIKSTIEKAETAQIQLAVMPSEPIQNLNTIAKLSQMRIVAYTLNHKMSEEATHWPQFMQEIGLQLTELTKNVAQSAKREIGRTRGEVPITPQTANKGSKSKRAKKQRQKERKAARGAQVNSNQQIEQEIAAVSEPQTTTVDQRQTDQTRKPAPFKRRMALADKTPPTAAHQRLTDQQFKQKVMQILTLRPIQYGSIDTQTERLNLDGTDMHLKLLYIKWVGEILGEKMKQDVMMRLSGVNQQILEEEIDPNQNEQPHQQQPDVTSMSEKLTKVYGQADHRTKQTQDAQPMVQMPEDDLPAQEVIFRDAPLQKDVLCRQKSNGKWTWDCKVHVHTTLGKGEQVPVLLFDKQVHYDLTQAHKASELQAKLWKAANDRTTTPFAYEQAKQGAADLVKEEHDVIHITRFHDPKGRTLLSMIRTDRQDGSLSIRYVPIPEEGLKWFDHKWVYDHIALEGYYPNVLYYRVVSSPNDSVRAVFKPDEAGEVLNRSESEMDILREVWMPLPEPDSEMGHLPKESSSKGQRPSE